MSQSGSESKKKRRTKTWAFATSVSAVFITVVIALIIFEGVLRFTRPTATESPARLIRPDPELGWATTPNLLNLRKKVAGRIMTVSTNSLGLRDRSIAPLDSNGGRRIIVLGDSTVFGLGVEGEQTFVKLLESRMRRDGQQIEALNAGRIGYGIGQYLLHYRQLERSVEHDLVLVCINIGDDIENTMMSVCEHRWKPAFALEGRRLELLSSPKSGSGPTPTRFSLVFDDLNSLFIAPESDLSIVERASGIVSRFSKQAMQRSALWRYISASRPEGALDVPAEWSFGASREERVDWIADNFYLVHGGWKYQRFWQPSQERSIELIGAILKRLGREAPDLLVALIPARAQVDPDWSADYIMAASRIGLSGEDLDFMRPNRLISAECQRQKLRSIDLLPAFAAADKPRRLFLPETTLLSPQGQEFITEALLAQLSEFGLLGGPGRRGEALPLGRKELSELSERAN
ncbi:hypothetical protein J7M28_08435 [bacterium]|nr:hypothetical protein [bacterium]